MDKEQEQRPRGAASDGIGVTAGRDQAAPAVDESVQVPTATGMRDLGERLAGLLTAGDLVVLSGSLGAGKTTLTQGIGVGLGVRGPVTSPTFVIARLHPSLHGGPDLVHADAYRLGSRAEVDDLDLDTDVATSVTVVEWGEGLVEDLAPSFLEVAITAAPPGGQTPADDPDEPRTVRIIGWGERWHGAAPAAREALAARDAS
jgi:tRNA threonylcarbamoyladenosine biosynthesis protein TsaE